MLLRTIALALFLAACTPAAEPPRPAAERQAANEGGGVQRTCIWVGDSLDSFASDGDADDVATHLIAQERDVAIKNLSSPGATLGLSNAFGYNSNWTTQSFNHICGMFRYCHCMVVTAGVNDFNAQVEWADIEQSLDRILSWAQARNVKVLMGDLIWSTRPESAPSSSMGMTFTQYRAQREAVCARYDVCRFASRPPEFDSEHPDLYASSEQAEGRFLHLNAQGQRIRATWLGRAGDGWTW